jgi:ribosome-associated protein
MPRKRKKEDHEPVVQAVLSAMADKKAKKPVVIEFASVKGAICDAFVICHGTSRTQTEAIAGHVIDEVKKSTGFNPWHREGFENAEWILIDYSDVVVHIFQEERRTFYNLEQLWADAVIREVAPTE